MAASSTPSSPAEAPDGASPIERAAADLEALTEKYDQCVRDLEDVEATADALLDDPHTRVLVLDAEQRIVAMSRGMAAMTGQREPQLGRAARDVLPALWPTGDQRPWRLSTADGWQELPLADGAGHLCLRRVTEDDREPLYVARLEPAPPGG